MYACPYCRKADAKRQYEKKVKIKYLETKSKMEFKKSTPIKYYKYKCPRCKGIFYTKEVYSKLNSHTIPKNEDLEAYDKRKTLNKIDTIFDKYLKNLEKEKFDTSLNLLDYKELEESLMNRKKIMYMYNEGEEPLDIKELILKTFGDDIRKDIELDIQELSNDDDINSLYQILIDSGYYTKKK